MSKFVYEVSYRANFMYKRLFFSSLELAVAYTEKVFSKVRHIAWKKLDWHGPEEVWQLAVPDELGEYVHITSRPLDLEEFEKL